MNDLLLVLCAFLAGVLGAALWGGLDLHLDVPEPLTKKADDVLGAMPPVVDGLQRAVELLKAEAEAVNASSKTVQESVLAVKLAAWIVVGLTALWVAALLSLRRFMRWAILRDLQTNEAFRDYIRELIGAKRRKAGT